MCSDLLFLSPNQTDLATAFCNPSELWNLLMIVMVIEIGFFVAAIALAGYYSCRMDMAKLEHYLVCWVSFYSQIKLPVCISTVLD